MTLARIAVVLVALLAPAAAHAQYDDDASGDYDVVVEIGDGFVTYNGDEVENFQALQEALAAEVQANPELSVEVVAHDDVAPRVVRQITAVMSALGIDFDLETVPSGTRPSGL